MAKNLTREYIVASFLIGAILTAGASGAVELDGIALIIVFAVVLATATWISGKEEEA